VTLATLEHEHRPDARADFRVTTTLWVTTAELLFFASLGIGTMF